MVDNVLASLEEETIVKGTVVRISNSKAGTPINAIILDRGGAVGFGKATLFDLLFAFDVFFCNGLKLYEILINQLVKC